MTPDELADTTPGETVTVVLTQRVKPGREDDYRRWQAGINLAAAEFPGFAGAEVTPPAEGRPEWSIVYRFDSVPHLQGWLDSRRRQDLLDEGSDLFAGSANQQIVTAPAPDQELVTVVVSHRIPPGLEDEFEAWHRRVRDAERGYPGFRGAELFRPVPGVQEEWTAVYRFDSSENLNAWLTSDRRKRLLREGRKFDDFQLTTIQSPFGSWFPLEGGGKAASQPDDFKTSIAVWVGLYPTVILLTLALDALLPDFELWQSLLLGTLVSSFAMTYVTMPHYVNRILRFYLAPAPGASPRRVHLLGLLAGLAWLAVWALVFWLTTTVIWDLG